MKIKEFTENLMKMTGTDKTLKIKESDLRGIIYFVDALAREHCNKKFEEQINRAKFKAGKLRYHKMANEVIAHLEETITLPSEEFGEWTVTLYE